MHQEEAEGGLRGFLGCQGGLLTARGTRGARPCPCRRLAADERGWKGRKKNKTLRLFFIGAAGRGEAPSPGPGTTPRRGKKPP